MEEPWESGLKSDAMYVNAENGVGGSAFKALWGEMQMWHACIKMSEGMKDYATGRRLHDASATQKELF